MKYIIALILVGMASCNADIVYKSPNGKAARDVNGAYVSLSAPGLMTQIQAPDLYITPTLNLESIQIFSGESQVFTDPVSGPVSMKLEVSSSPLFTDVVFSINSFVSANAKQALTFNFNGAVFTSNSTVYFRMIDAYDRSPITASLWTKANNPLTQSGLLYEDVVPRNNRDIVTTLTFATIPESNHLIMILFGTALYSLYGSTHQRRKI